MAFDSLRQQTIMVTEPVLDRQRSHPNLVLGWSHLDAEVLAVQPSSRFAALVGSVGIVAPGRESAAAARCAVRVAERSRLLAHSRL